MAECSCQIQSRGDLCWHGDFSQIQSFDRSFGDFSFRVTLIKCNQCLRRYEVMADDTPAYRTIYQWSSAGSEQEES